MADVERDSDFLNGDSTEENEVHVDSPAAFLQEVSSGSQSLSKHKRQISAVAF